MTSSNEHIPSSVYLVDYFIYCPLLCGKEGQEDRKILYYYPSNIEIDQQIRTIGYCEGLVKFTETFAFDDPCESVHFQKSRLLFYKVENDICLAMTLHIPIIERKKDEKIFMEYCDENVNDKLMLPILKISYRYFVLQYGTMFELIQQNGIDEFRNILKKYFDKFIEYHLHKMICNATIDSSYYGIEFLSAEKDIYLKIQTILRRFELRFTSLEETFLLYRNQLIWSGLNQDDTNLIYSFFRLYYWPHIKKFLNTSIIRYLTVNTSANLIDELIISTDLTSQEFYLGSLFIPYRIVVINSNFLTIFCIFNNDKDLLNKEEILSIIELIKKDLDRIFINFEEYSRRKYSITDHTIKNVYYNKINMAHSSTIDWKQESNNNIASIMNTLAEDLQWFYPIGEIMVKGENDPWIVAKRSDMRELLVSVNQKNANLKEIKDKIKQIFSTQFNNIFLLE